MDWEKFWMTWGPPAPFMAFLLKMLYDLLYKIVPDGFSHLQGQMVLLENQAKDRHAEHMAALYELIDRTEPDLVLASAALKKKRRRRNVRQTAHGPPT